jgi:cyclophilin family peptidyl-prolyl cis-trans isomerase
MKRSIVIFITAVLVLLIIIGFYFGSKMTVDSIKQKENPKVKLTTSEGDIVIELYPSKAPITADNFLTYVSNGFYENTVFHRVIKDFMIQGGGFTKEGTQKQTNNPIKLESDNGLKNEIGTLAMARTPDPNSATSQFFININNNSFLDYGVRDEGYAVFGKVVSGMDIVRKIEQSETGTKYNMRDWPTRDIMILKTEIIL